MTAPDRVNALLNGVIPAGTGPCRRAVVVGGQGRLRTLSSTGLAETRLAKGG
jgi:hypothetical protein